MFGDTVSHIEYKNLCAIQKVLKHKIKKKYSGFRIDKNEIIIWGSNKTPFKKDKKSLIWSIDAKLAVGLILGNFYAKSYLASIDDFSEDKINESAEKVNLFLVAASKELKNEKSLHIEFLKRIPPKLEFDYKKNKAINKESKKMMENYLTEFRNGFKDELMLLHNYIVKLFHERNIYNSRPEIFYKNYSETLSGVFEHLYRPQDKGEDDDEFYAKYIEERLAPVIRFMDGYYDLIFNEYHFLMIKYIDDDELVGNIFKSARYFYTLRIFLITRIVQILKILRN